VESELRHNQIFRLNFERTVFSKRLLLTVQIAGGERVRYSSNEKL